MLLIHIRRSGPERKKAIDHYTVYGGTLLIRNDADGRSYLYDLLDVQKKKVISAPSFSATAARRSEVFAPKPSANSIPASDGNVNTEKLSTGQSIDEMAGEDADTGRGGVFFCITDGSHMGEAGAKARH